MEVIIYIIAIVWVVAGWIIRAPIGHGHRRRGGHGGHGGH